MWFGGGSIIGFVSGYALKKLIKWICIIGGLFALGVMALSYVGVARIDWQKAEQMSRSAAVNASHQVYNVINNTATQYMHNSDTQTLPVISAAGFIIGLLVGLKKG